MSSKNVIWPSDSCLPCSCQGTVNVFLLLKTGEIVEAQLLATTGGPSCSKAKYQYTFEYDTLNLPDGYTVLSSLDIDGAMCEGVFSAYVANYFTQSGAGLFAGANVLPFVPSYYAASGTESWVDLTPDDNFYFKFGEFAYISARFHSGVTSGTADGTDLIIGMPTEIVLVNTQFISSSYVENGTGPFTGQAVTDVPNNQILGRKEDSSVWALGALTGFSLNGIVRIAT